MNTRIQVKRVILLSIVSIVPLCAMENGEKKLDVQKVENQKRESESQYKFLRYDKNAHIEVDEKKLPEGVKRMFGNTFIMPKEMDPALIHKELVFKKNS